MELGDNGYRIFYQRLQKVKEQLSVSATRLITPHPEEHQEDVASQERLSVIIREQLGDDTLVVYQQAYNEGQAPVESRPSKREEELEQQLVDLQKGLVKLQKENEQFRLANQRWAQDYDELLSQSKMAPSAREKELEDRAKMEKNNFEVLRGKYNLLEQTLKEEREELMSLRRELQRARQRTNTDDDITDTMAELQQAFDNSSKELEEVKKTKERYRLERNRYYHELEKQRRTHEAERKQQADTIKALESQCERMRTAFAQISDIVYPPKTTTSSAKPKSTSRSSQKPPGHVARAPLHASDVEHDRHLPTSGRRDEQVTGVAQLNSHDFANSNHALSPHVIPCTACNKEIPLDKFLEHMENCTANRL